MKKKYEKPLLGINDFAQSEDAFVVYADPTGPNSTGNPVKCVKCPATFQGVKTPKLRKTSAPATTRCLQDQLHLSTLNWRHSEMKALGVRQICP